MVEGRNKLIITFVTVPSMESASLIAQALVQEQLAACVNIIPGLTSVYLWNDKLESSSELLLKIKTISSSFPALEKRILELHPYKTPEIIALPTESVSGDYLQWVYKSVLNEEQL